MQIVIVYGQVGYKGAETASPSVQYSNSSVTRQQLNHEPISGK